MGRSSEPMERFVFGSAAMAAARSYLCCFRMVEFLIAASFVSSNMNELCCGAGTAVFVIVSTFFINCCQSDSRGVVWWGAPGWLGWPWWSDVPPLGRWDAPECGRLASFFNCVVQLLASGLGDDGSFPSRSRSTGSPSLFVLSIDLPDVVVPGCVAVCSAKLKVTVGRLCGGEVRFPARKVAGAAIVLGPSGRFVCMCRSFLFVSSFCVVIGCLHKLCLSLCWGGGSTVSPPLIENPDRRDPLSFCNVLRLRF